MAQPRRPDDEELPERPEVRRLRLWTMGLMGALGVMAITLAGAMVWALVGLGGPPRAAGVGAGIVLPEGHEVVGLGQWPGTVLTLTRDPEGGESLRVFDAGTGEPLSVTPVDRE